MEVNEVYKFLEEGSISVPVFLIKNYKKFNLEDQEFILLLYLIKLNNKVYNPKEIAFDINFSVNDVMTLVSNLEEKDLLEIKWENNINNQGFETIKLSPLYIKMINLIFSNLEENKNENSIFEIFEKEFARNLTPIEYEIINGWTENNYSKEVLLYALKEAIYNGVKSFRYIDKLLYTWDKKGFKTVLDIEKGIVDKNNKIEDGFTYNWLDSSE